jgi:hypothetical protein
MFEEEDFLYRNDTLVNPPFLPGKHRYTPTTCTRSPGCEKIFLDFRKNEKNNNPYFALIDQIGIGDYIDRTRQLTSRSLFRNFLNNERLMILVTR